MVKDVLHKEGDLLFQNGDFAVGVSDEQHINDIILHEKGNFRQNPALGVGIMQYLNSPHNTLARTELEGKVKRQLEFDGFSVFDVRVLPNFELYINAELYAD